jgi:type VI secretion system protein
MTIRVDQEDISIGRSSDNGWVLPDPENDLSRIHALIQFENSRYYITDTSSNGVFFLPSTTPLGRQNTAELNNGDMLRLGEYQIQVSIDDSQNIEQTQPAIPEQTESESFDFFDSDTQKPDVFDDITPGSQAPKDPAFSMTSEDNDLPVPKEFSNKAGFDTFDFFEDDTNKPATPSNTESDHASSLDEAFFPAQGHQDNPPPVEKKAAKRIEPNNNVFLPENWLDADDESATTPDNTPVGQEDATDPFDFEEIVNAEIIEPAMETAEPEPEPEPVVAPIEEVIADHSRDAPVSSPIQTIPEKNTESVVGANHDEIIQRFLEGIGLPEQFADSMDPETFYTIGRMLRTSLQGTMDVLLARTKIKSEMRLDVTTIRSVKNNPVKFSYNVDEAVSRLLGKEKSEGYMEPIRAIEEAFEDIRAHQIAVLAGMQTALKSILKRFDPETLEKRLQKLSPISASIPIHKQAKLWDQFQQLYEDIEREAQDDFNRLFGDAFSSAYEEQIQKLKSQNN